MKKLLLASDLSPRSELALRRALRLAREHGAAVAAVHIVDESLKPPSRCIPRTISSALSSGA